MNMDSIQQLPHQRIIRGSSELDRFRRVNAAPYDDPITRSSQLSRTNSKRFMDFIKDKMSGAISGIKGLFHDGKKASLESIPLSQSLQIPPFSQDKLKNLSSSIQQTIMKPEYQSKYTTALERNSETKRTSLMNVVDYYKDVSTEKVRETMKRENSNTIPQAVDCQRRPVPLYSQKNTAIEAARSSQGKDQLNKNGKRLLRSILYPKEKHNKGNKKVSFVPELQRSASSVIKYNSSDDEDSIYIQDTPQKKIFIDDKVILKNEPIIQLSLIKAKKLNPNPFHQKRLIEKSAKARACLNEKGMKKKFSEEFGTKYNKGGSFGSDNPINDSKVETDSDDSSLLYNNNPFDSQNFQILKSLENKKNQRNRMESSSDQAEKEDHTLSISSSQKMDSPNIPDVEEEEDTFAEEVVEDKKKVEEKKIEIEAPKKPEEKKEQTAKPLLFQTIQAPKENQEMKSPQTGPKQRGSLISLLMQEPKEEKKTIVEEKPKQLFSLFNNSQAATQEKPAESTQSKLPFTSANKEAQPSKENIVEEAKTTPTTKLFSNGTTSLFAQNNEKQNSPLAPVQTENKKEEATPVAPVLAKAGSTIDPEAAKNHLFAGYLNNNIPSLSENPFLKATSQKSMSFADLISGGNNTAPVPEQKVEIQKSSSTLFTGNSNSTAAEDKATGILELFKTQSSKPAELGLKRTLTPTTELGWMSSHNDSSKPNLFNNMADTPSAQQSLFQPAPNDGGAFGTLFQNNQGSSGLFGNSNNNMGENSSLFSNNSLTPSNSLFGGNSNSGLGGMLGNSSNQSGGLGIFGNNNNNNNSSVSNNNNNNTFNNSGNLLSSNNPFLSQSSFGGNSSSNFGGNDNALARSNSIMGSGHKKKGQKERAF